MMLSKCHKIRLAWAAGDHFGALRIAARFFDRSVETQIFKGLRVRSSVF